MNKKILYTFIVVILWAIGAFLMSILYYYFLQKGIIWNNPNIINEFIPWNSRKVIFAIIGISSFILLIVKIASIWEDNN